MNASDSLQAAIADRLLPVSSSDPTWIVFILILAALIGVLGWRWIDSRRAQPAAATPPEWYGEERRQSPGEAAMCVVHREKVETMEENLVSLRVDLANQATSMQVVLHSHFKELMDEFRKEMDRREQKQMDMIDQKLTAFESKAMTSLIQACRAIALQAVSDRIEKKTEG